MKDTKHIEQDLDKLTEELLCLNQLGPCIAAYDDDLFRPEELNELRPKKRNVFLLY